MGLRLLAAVVLAGAVAALGCDCGPGSERSDRQRRDIVFPDSPREPHYGRRDHDTNTNLLTQLTIEDIHRLDESDSLDEIVRILSNKSEEIEPPIVSRMSFSVLSGTGIKVATRKKCTPRPQIVSLTTEEHVSHLFVPDCIEVERCGGCCIWDKLRSCQPTKTIMEQFIVTKIRTWDRTPSQEIVSVEKHLECGCQCIQKAENCNSLQEFNQRDCKCQCGNGDERQKCKDFSEKKWDEDTCRCICRRKYDCTTGLEFDENTCTCTPIAQIRGHAPDNSYKLDKRRRRWPNTTARP